MSVRKPVSDVSKQMVNALVNEAAKIYTERTGKPMNGKTLVFVKGMVMSMIDLVEDAVRSGGNINMKHIAALATARALETAGLMAEEKSWNECLVATISLALATTNVFGIMVAATAMSSTGAGAVVGVPVLLSAGVFYAYEVSEMAQTCGEAFVKSEEKKFEASYRASSKRSLMSNYSNMVCTAPP